MLFKADTARTTEAAEAELGRLRKRIDDYEDPALAYLSHPNPGATPAFADYAQLARVKEWQTVDEEGTGE